MQAGVLERNLLDRHRQADYEAYHYWEYQRRLYDEITDVAERVRAPIAPTQEFTLTAEGLVSPRGEPLRPVIEKGLQEARRMARFNPDWQVEVLRREIDLEEYYALETLAFEGEGAGALVSYWLIPDAVRNGASTLPGYNRERLKMFTRIAVPTEKGVAIKYHSYDKSYLPGVQAMDESLGFTFDPTLGSEDRARNRRRIAAPVESVETLDEILRSAYDGALTRDLGGVWYGGRAPLPVKDVVGFISDQKWLLDPHMNKLTHIFALTRDPFERNELMEPYRYDLAAAIDDLLHSKPVTSAGEAGDNARSEGRSFDRDCPTGENATDQQFGQLGFKAKKSERMRIWINGECRTCLVVKAVEATGCHMCLDCEQAHEFGGDAALDQIIREAKDRRARQERAIARKRKKQQTMGKMTLKQSQVIAPVVN